MSRYLATQKDLKAIEEGIKTVWRKELDFVFKKRGLLENVIVISYDSEFLYLWTKIKLPKLKTFTTSLSCYYAYKIPHKIKIKDEWQLGWVSYLPIKQFVKLLPKRLQKSDFEIPKISGGLLTPFIKFQKKKKGVKFNPYTTHESYLATIVHEFGHVYWNQHKLWWHSDKKQNLTYLRNALRPYRREKIKYQDIKLPTEPGRTELFAFCTEYVTAQKFWPNHQKNLDKTTSIWIKKAIKDERKKDLEKENSFFDDSRLAHQQAAILSRLIFNRFSGSWPDVLLKKPFLS